MLLRALFSHYGVWILAILYTTTIEDCFGEYLSPAFWLRATAASGWVLYAGCVVMG